MWQNDYTMTYNYMNGHTKNLSTTGEQGVCVMMSDLQMNNGRQSGV